MFLKGFKFGMLLQFAIGPICLFIFQMASIKGFYLAITGVLGVLIIDGIYILFAILGITSIIERENTKIILKIFGSVVLFIFGTSTVLNAFNISILPSLGLKNISNSTTIFSRAIILTASNPLTILFWAGVFSTKITEENMERKDIYNFGFGALLATIFFLTLIAFVGSFTRTLFPTYIIEILNLTVGLLLVYFGIRMIHSKI